MNLSIHSVDPTGIRCLALALAALVLGGVLGIAPAGAQQGSGSGVANVSAIEIKEMETALEVAQKQLAKAELEAAELEKANALLRQSLVESNRVADEVREQYEDLLLRMASYGVDLVKPDPKSLEHRLLQAVRDCERAEKSNAQLRANLAQLSEAVMGYLPASQTPDAGARARVEAELASAEMALTREGAMATSSQGQAERALDDGRVVSIDPEVGLLVVNVGRGSGIRVGMPLLVVREDQPVGTAQVVDVRDAVAGALLQSLGEQGDVKVGDRIEPQAGAL